MDLSNLGKKTFTPENCPRHTPIVLESVMATMDNGVVMIVTQRVWCATCNMIMTFGEGGANPNDVQEP